MEEADLVFLNSRVVWCAWGVGSEGLGGKEWEDPVYEVIQRRAPGPRAHPNFYSMG